MHIGIYVPSLGSSKLHEQLFNKLNELVDSQQFDDVSVFYDDIDFISVQPRFGIFNSTELWNFTGTLFLSSLDMIPQIKATINKFKSVVMYDGSTDLLKVLSGINEYEVLTYTQEQSDYLKRVSGKETHLMENLNFIEYAGLAK